MERTTDWKVPAALILAGLALLVALSGRNAFTSFSDPQAQSIVIAAEPAGPDFQPPPAVDPNALGDPSNAVPKGGSFSIKPVPPMPGIQKMPAPPFVQAFPGPGKVQYAVGESRGPIDGISSYIEGLIAYLSPLFQLGAVVLLIWLAYRYLTQRNRPRPGYVAAPPPPPQAPPPPATMVISCSRNLVRRTEGRGRHAHQDHSRGGGRARHRHDRKRLPQPGRLPGAGRGRWQRRPRPGALGEAQPDAARPDAAGPGWPRHHTRPAPRPCHAHHAHHHAHRSRGRDGQAAGPRAGGRRLYNQAVQPAGGGGSRAGRPAQERSGRTIRRRAAGRIAHGGPGQAPGVA